MYVYTYLDKYTCVYICTYLRYFQSFRQRPAVDLHVAVTIYTLNYHIIHFSFISLVEIQSYTGDFDFPPVPPNLMNLWAETTDIYLRQVHLLSWSPREGE